MDVCENNGVKCCLSIRITKSIVKHSLLLSVPLLFLSCLISDGEYLELKVFDFCKYGSNSISEWNCVF
jgi:hypothetical protein